MAPETPSRSAEPLPLHFRYAESRDPRVLTELTQHYRGYATALARRLHRNGEPLEDLVQVAMEALLLALQRFDPARSIPFVAFATPTIIGSLKRHYRDNGWAVRVPRRVHELVAPARQAADEIAAELGRPARVTEVAERLGVPVEPLLEAQEAAHARATSSLDVAVGPDQVRGDLIGAEDTGLMRAENRLALRQALDQLEGRERELLRLYYCEEMSQHAIGERFGVSQMQVSRWLHRAVRRLRGRMVAA